jgi:hypothetical protein
LIICCEHDSFEVCEIVINSYSDVMALKPAPGLRPLQSTQLAVAPPFYYNGGIKTLLWVEVHTFLKPPL